MMKKYFFSIVAAFVAFTSHAEGRYKGDLNGDGKVDLADMVFLAKAIQSGSTDNSMDVNLSGKVDDNDFHTLANIIISGKLTKDNGLNVGIGGWDETGEDFGGTVNAPAFRSNRSAFDIQFYLEHPKNEGNSRTSLELGIRNSDTAVSAILFNIECSGDVIVFDQQPLFELCEDLLDGHKLYGTPKLISDGGGRQDKIIRFIVFSPDLKPLKNLTGKLGKLFYSYADVNLHFYEYKFTGCQVAESNSGTVVDVGLSKDLLKWQEIPVEEISFQESELRLGVGEVRYDFSLFVYPADTTDAHIVVQSSDEEVVSIPYIGNGGMTILGRKEGEAEITATASNGLRASCKVTVGNGGAVSTVANDSGPYKVYDTGGRLLRTADLPAELRRLPPGIYIIRTPNHSYKLTL